MEKSHVGMAYKICKICGSKTEESILFHKRLKRIFKKENIIGYNICDKCQSIIDKGMTAIIIIENEDDQMKKDKYTIEEIKPTGISIFVEKEKLKKSITTLYNGEDVILLSRKGVKKLTGMTIEEIKEKIPQAHDKEN